MSETCRHSLSLNWRSYRNPRISPPAAAAQSQPAGSELQLDYIGVATDIALALEAYSRQFGAQIADPG